MCALLCIGTCKLFAYCQDKALLCIGTCKLFAYCQDKTTLLSVTTVFVSFIHCCLSQTAMCVSSTHCRSVS